MSEGRPIPVRLTEDTIKRLDDVANSTGLGHRTAVIKMCLKTFLDHFEAEGEAALPLNWKQIMHEQDGRSSRYHIAAEANGKNSTVIVNHNADPMRYKIGRKKNSTKPEA